MAQWVKDLVMSLQWLPWVMLRCGLDPWARNLHMTQGMAKKKERKLNKKGTLMF